MRQTVAYILSTNYAGSHYLSLLLGSNSRARHIGEVCQLRRPVGQENLRECELRRGTVLADIGPDNIDRIYDIIFSRFAQSNPPIEVLVDTSKRIEGWADRFVGTDRHQLKFIHLIRDPRALVRRFSLRSTFYKQLRQRWKMFRAFPGSHPSLLFAPEPYVWLHVWLRQNQAITRFTREHRLDTALVTYRDLALHTGREVERLMTWLGLTYEPGQLEYWNFDHIGTQKKGYEWVKEQKTTYFDLRWQKELPAAIQQGIARHPLVTAYLADLGLHMTDDGLTRDANRPDGPASPGNAAPANAPAQPRTVPA